MDKSKNYLMYLMCGYVCLEIMLNTNFTEVIPESVINAFRYSLLFIMIIFACLIIINNICLTQIIFGVIAILTLLFAKTTFVLVLFVMFVLTTKFEHKKIVSYLNNALLFILFLTVLSSVLGIIPSATSIRQGVNRLSLGFASCTMSQSLFMFVSLNFLYLKKKNINILFLIAEFIVASVFYYYTQARTGYLLTILVLCLNLLLKLDLKFRFFKKISSQKPFLIFCVFIPLIFLAISIYMTYLYNNGNNFALKINRMLSARLLFQRNAFINHPLTLFGDKINWVDDYGNYCGVDNSYLFYIFNYGIISTVVLYSIISLNFYKSLKNKNYLLFVIIFIICINAIVEPYLADFKYNYIMFYISSKSSVGLVKKSYKNNEIVSKIDANLGVLNK